MCRFEMIKVGFHNVRTLQTTPTNYKTNNKSINIMENTALCRLYLIDDQVFPVCHPFNRMFSVCLWLMRCIKTNKINSLTSATYSS